MPLTQMRFDIFFQNGRYLIERVAAASAGREEKPRRAVHEGTDPRAYMGVDPALRPALRQFVERERAWSDVIRRVVTTHAPDGRAVILSDGHAPNVGTRSSGTRSTLMWTTGSDAGDLCRRTTAAR